MYSMTKINHLLNRKAMLSEKPNVMCDVKQKAVQEIRKAINKTSTGYRNNTSSIDITYLTQK